MIVAMRRISLVIALTACGSVSGKNPDAGTTHDAPNADSHGTDAVAPPCDVTKPFSTLVNLAGVNSNSTDDWGWFSADELTIYFSSAATNSSDLNLYQATRASTAVAFSTPQLMGAINTTNVEERPAVTADGLTLFAQSNATGTVHIYVATRTSPAAQFGSLGIVAGVNGNTVDADPWISADGLTMYMTSTRSGNNNYDLYTSTRTNTSATFGTPVPISELNTTTSVEDAPVLSADGLELFFASNRAATSMGRNDVWHATRATTADMFGTPTLVAEVSGDASEDFPTWLSADRCTLLLSSDRTAGSNGGYDIWIATRPQ
jgi:hypothetical protein